MGSSARTTLTGHVVTRTLTVLSVLIMYNVGPQACYHRLLLLMSRSRSSRSHLSWTWL
jgi:hypothetical protein